MSRPSAPMILPRVGERFKLRLLLKLAVRVHCALHWQAGVRGHGDGPLLRPGGGWPCCLCSAPAAQRPSDLQYSYYYRQ